jgi:aspartokinase
MKDSARREKTALVVVSAFSGVTDMLIGLKIGRASCRERV